ncbi:MAG: penicillin-binding protein 2, partial [Treponema sp.]|nr:penicillin-binding protein 2 [Treponema sp.]
MNNFFSKWRIIVLAIFGCLFIAAIYLKYIKLAFTPLVDIPNISPSTERGSILDRNGKKLAIQTDFYHLGVSPNLINDKEDFAKKISPIIGINEEDILNTLKNAKNFTYLRKKMDRISYEEIKKAIDETGYSSVVNYDQIPGRIYPENALASQLIGFMGNDGVGLSGIEYSMQDTLSPQLTSDIIQETYGQNVYLTIDANLQFNLEEIARDTMRQTQAESMMMLVADAKSGELLSYISLPSANLNEYTSASQAQTVDRPAVTAYEPGSVFKIFTAASFLDAGVITDKDAFLCDGIYEKTTASGEKIRITCLGQHGLVTVREALQYSCNDAIAQMSDLMDTPQFLNRLKRLGFGEKTGIELPGETKGSVKKETDKFWSARSKPTMAIGQELSVSALQIIQAATAIANKGIPIQLTVISKLTDHNENILFVHKPVYKQRVFSEETTKIILSDMETVAKIGTGTKASLKDISIGVKTGTAQMADPVNGGYSDTDFLSNCIAIFPVEEPEIILYIVIEKAKGETYAGRIVAPVIKKAADVIIDHIGMDRAGAIGVTHTGKISIKSNQPIVIKDVVPDFSGLSKRDLLSLVQRNDI